MYARAWSSCMQATVEPAYGHQSQSHPTIRTPNSEKEVTKDKEEDIKWKIVHGEWSLGAIDVCNLSLCSVRFTCRIHAS